MSIHLRTLLEVSLLLLRTVGTYACHPGCRCEVETFGLFGSFSLTTVDCSGSDPSSIPPSVPMDTSFLNLSSSHIRVLTESTLTGPGYTTLAGLDLSHNLITDVTRGSFSRLRYLESLDLHGNELQDVPAGCFQDLLLSRVDLSHNRLRELRLDSFGTGPGRAGTSLSVDASHNLLSAVSARTPAGPQNLHGLNLAWNLLGEVPPLRDVPLRSLHLDGNPISVLVGGAFAGLTELLHLSLSQMAQLTHLQPGCFRGLGSLQVLDLSHTPLLWVLSPALLEDLPTLRELHLSGSGVTVMPQLAQIPMLDNLDCRGRRRKLTCK